MRCARIVGPADSLFKNFATKKMKRNRAGPKAVTTTKEVCSHWLSALPTVRNPGIDDQSIPGFSRKER